MKRTPVSREADKFVVRMPDGMRERFQGYKENRHVSMNTAIIQGLDSFLDGHEELQILLAGTRLLQQQLAERLSTMEQEAAEIAALKAKLNAQVASGQAST